ncbi:hypothetical protein FB451DRAFT_1495522 [Mycena latifolia]|nr:hypothetical protein FB451DRAFT_1495522 [Mycena latifolia]
MIEPACTSRARELQDQGRGFYQDKYKAHFDNLFDAAATHSVTDGLNPLRRTRGTHSWRRLGAPDARPALRRGGNLQFKKTLWEDVWATPQSRASSTRTPRSTSSSRTSRSRGATNLFPNVVAVEAHNYVQFSRDAPRRGAKWVAFSFAQMQADMRDVALYFRTKPGIRMSDAGRADVVRGGQGVTATVTLASSAATDPTSVFTVNTSGALHTACEYADARLVRRRAREGGGGGRREALGDRNKEDVSSVVSSAASASQFKVVVNKRNSLLPAAGSPAGWVNRTAAKDARAVQEEKWCLAAFDIVDAKTHRAANGGPKL